MPQETVVTEPPWSTDEKIEAQRWGITCPPAHDRSMALAQRSAPPASWYCLVHAEAAIPFLTNSSFPKTGSQSPRRVLSWEIMKEADAQRHSLPSCSAYSHSPLGAEGLRSHHDPSAATWAAHPKRPASPLATSLVFFSQGWLLLLYLLQAVAVVSHTGDKGDSVTSWGNCSENLQTRLYIMRFLKSGVTRTACF